MGFNDFREVAYGKDDVPYPLLFQMRQQDFQERLASNRGHGFRQIRNGGSQPSAEPSCKDDSFPHKNTSFIRHGSEWRPTQAAGKGAMSPGYACGNVRSCEARRYSL